VAAAAKIDSESIENCGSQWLLCHEHSNAFLSDIFHFRYLQYWSALCDLRLRLLQTLSLWLRKAEGSHMSRSQKIPCCLRILDSASRQAKHQGLFLSRFQRVEGLLSGPRRSYRVCK
jgi:hypothetical protein